MGKDSKISWCDHTFNIVWGCTKISPGCKNCYADAFAKRYGLDLWGPSKPRRTFGQKHWKDPLTWNHQAEKAGKRAKVFVGSMCDWAEDHPTTEAELKKLWPIIRQTPWLDWLLLTKRAERIAKLLPEDYESMENLWLGVTVECSCYASRIDHLFKLNPAIRFISYEPALGPLAEALDLISFHEIDWVIYGGESGPQFRPHCIEWARDMRELCKEEGVSFFYKQSPGIKPGQNSELDGQVIQQWPEGRTA